MGEGILEIGGCCLTTGRKKIKSALCETDRIVQSEMYMALPAVQHLSRLGHLEILEVDEEDLNTENLHAHVVAEDTKRLLLTETDRHPLTPAPSPSSVSPSLDAETLLQDLGQLAPSVAKTLTLKQQAQDNLVFSLINDVDFDEEERSFIALSYCWKKISRETPRKEVSHVGELPFGWVREVEQFPLPTSRAMFEAVLRERRDEMEGLWFDQVFLSSPSSLIQAFAALTSNRCVLTKKMKRKRVLPSGP